MGNLLRNIVFAIIGVILIGLAVSMLTGSAKTETVPLSQITSLLQDQKVTALEVNPDQVIATVKDKDAKLVATTGANTEIPQFFKDSGVPAEKIASVKIEYKNTSTWVQLLGTLLPFIIPLVLFGVLIWFFIRQMQGSNNRALTFGQSSVRLHDERKNQVRFSDVAGAKEAKAELQEVVEFLKFPQKFLALGAKIPKGVLLLGSPGVGKTMLARAVAGEANVPFFHISGSEFVEMFVGVGASRVRDLFKKAKKNAPCIVFIDEIDAVGRQRGTGLGGGHDEREQTLNQILVEMDGFETDTNVIVMAATNRPDVLDPALLRPGRFDRQVVLDLPDADDREAILKVHAKNKPLASVVNIRQIAERTPGFSGADLANLMNEAAILAARLNQTEITTDHLREAIEKVTLGPQRQSHILSQEEKKVTAYHEGGHALVATVLEHADPVHKVTVLSRGRAAGYTMKLPIDDKKMHTRSSFLDEIAVLLGGYTAEKLVFSELTTGASNDLKVATGMARRLITAYGMSDALGPVSLGEQQENVFLGRELAEHRNYSEDVARQIDDEVRRIMREAEARAQQVLTEHRSYLDKVAESLLKQETLEQDEFNALVADILPAHKKRVPEFSDVAPTT